jgi:rubrerythrin
MGHTNQPDRKALEAALEFEEKGVSFFKDSAAKAANTFAKEVFEFLAGEELKHIDAVNKFYIEYLKGNSSDAETLMLAIKTGKSTTSIDLLFKHLAEIAPAKGSELDVYKFAMDFELKGEAFYKKAETEAVDPNAKKLYGFLIGEERKHFKIVEACMDYFENPSEYFHQHEKWHFEN